MGTNHLSEEPDASIFCPEDTGDFPLIRHGPQRTRSRRLASIRGYTDTQTHTHGQQRDLISLLYFFKIRKYANTGSGHQYWDALSALLSRLCTCIQEMSDITSATLSVIWTELLRGFSHFIQTSSFWILPYSPLPPNARDTIQSIYFKQSCNVRNKRSNMIGVTHSPASFTPSTTKRAPVPTRYGS
jgi:hypothetical protein